MRARLSVLILMTTLFVAGLLASQYVFQPPAAESGSAMTTQVATVLTPPRELPEFELVNQAGQPFDRQALSGRWTLVFMGFTNCGHICPTTLYTLSEAVGRLPAPPDVLFVSVDPERDSPEVIDKYVRGFGAGMRGATGSDAQLRQIAERLGAPFRVTRDEERYVVDHSSAVFLLDPNARFRALFSAPHDADVIAQDLAQIMREPQEVTAS